MADREIFDLLPLTAALDTELEGQQAGGLNSGKLTIADILALAAPVAWGEITGTLSDQTDLQNALDAKAEASTLSSHIADASIHYADAPVDGVQYARKDGAWEVVSTAGQVSWGDIIGTLSNQTDLQAALDAKASLTGATFTGNITLTDSQVRLDSNNLTALRFRRLSDPGSQGMRFQDSTGRNRFALFLDGDDNESFKLTTYTTAGNLSRTVLNFALETGALDMGAGILSNATLQQIPSMEMRGSNPTIFTDTAGGNLLLYGGITGSDGGVIILSGANNTTFPYGIRFRRGNTEVMQYIDDADAALRAWSFKDTLIHDVREIRLNGGAGASGLGELPDTYISAARQGYANQMWAQDLSSNLRIVSLNIDGTFTLPGGIDPVGNNDATRKAYVDGITDALDARITALENA